MKISVLSKWSTVIVYVVLKIKNDTFSLKTENRNCLLFETAKRKKKKKNRLTWSYQLIASIPRGLECYVLHFLKRRSYRSSVYQHL